MCVSSPSSLSSEEMEGQRQAGHDMHANEVILIMRIEGKVYVIDHTLIDRCVIYKGP